MSAAQLRSQYRRMCKHRVTIRRYVTSGGVRRSANYPVMGNARLYSANELVNGIVQGDWKIIALAEDLDGLGFPHPLTTDDKVVVGGRERAVIVPGTRSALEGDLIAYEIQAR